MKIITLCLVLLWPAALIGAERPNIIVIMADDLGAEGLASYGSTIYSTPNLDRMAAEGQRYLNAYATPLCTPSRVMIMSGLYPNRTGYKALMGKDEGVRMPAEIRTFGNDFKEAGYKTAMAGKWQLGKFGEHPQQAVEHGFDEYCMWTWFHEGKKTSRYYKPHLYTNGGFFQGKESDYGPDFYANFVLNFIDRNKDEPFFIYFPMALTHTPFSQPPSLVELATSKYPEGLDKNTHKFGMLITYMDDIVGKIMARLKANGIEDKTMVLFTSDNGSHKSVTSKLEELDVQGGKGSLTEAGTRVPLLAWWPGKIKPSVREEFFCLVDVLPTVCSVADIPLKRKVDGMDLSHYFTENDSRDREHIFITWKTGSFLREKRFRLNATGKSENVFTLYDVQAASDSERYGELVANNPEYQPELQRMKALLENYQAIAQEYRLKRDSE